MNERFEILEQQMLKEVEKIETRLKGGQEMSIEDLKKLDLLYHTLKSKATYDAMSDAKYYDSGMSGRRGRNMNNGQYMSRDFADGYSRGFDDARNYDMGMSRGTMMPRM